MTSPTYTSTTTPKTEGEAATIGAMGAALGNAKANPTPDGAPYTLVPEGYRLETLPTFNWPARKTGSVVVHDIASFARVFKDHAGDGSRVYADQFAQAFTAVLDEHPTGGDVAGFGGWRQFRVVHALAPTPAYSAWLGKNGQRMNQTEMAAFVQDRMADVAIPSGGELLEMVLNFEAASSGQFISSQRLMDGSQALTYRNESSQVGTLKLPSEMRLSLPVYRGSDPAELVARLRYRVRESQLSLWFELVDLDQFTEEAFAALTSKVRALVGDVVLMGKP